PPRRPPSRFRRAPPHRVRPSTRSRGRCGAPRGAPCAEPTAPAARGIPEGVDWPAMETALVDGHGRRITYVRISVTDRCNLRCVYCMPEDQKFRPLAHLLTRDEIRRTAAILRTFGAVKIRITGGEPTTRPDLVGIVGDLAAIGFPGGIALSTNGVLFPRMAKDLLAAGLTKVNVSLDAAEAEHFRKLTRRDHYQPVRD